MMRALVTGFVMHFKMLARGGMELSGVTFWPIIYATLGNYMYRAGHQTHGLFYVTLGATMMAMWTSTAFACGGAIQRQRYLGTLELMVASPVPFLVVLLPITLAATALGVYALVVSIGVSYLVYGIPITVVHPLLFLLSLPLAILAIGALGLLMASVLVVYRYANSLATSSEYPVWLVCGLLAPLTLLPAWVHPISWLLAPTWGMAALRNSALGGRALWDLGMCLAVTAAYALLAAVFIANFERMARRQATLALT